MARLPSSVRFAALCSCLRFLLSRLSSISVTFRRLLYVLLNFLRSCQPRQPPCPIQHLSQPVGGFPSAQSVVPPGIAANTLSTTPTNASVRSTGRSSSASIASFVAAPEIIDLQHPPRDMIPFVASAVQRYGKNVRIESSRGKETISPMEQYPERHLPDSANWKAYVHPEGALYFYHPLKRVFTDSDAQEERFLTDLNACTSFLCALAEGDGVQLTDEIELTVQLGLDSNTGRSVCSYYFVDRAKRTLFWLHHLGTGDLFDGVRGVKEPSHILLVNVIPFIVIKASKHIPRIHCELYPNDREVESQNGLLMELREIVMHASADIITSDKSLSPFGGEELSKILDLISHLQETTSKECRPHSMCVIARFMQYFARAKFFNFCGQPCARLEADQSIYLMKDEHVVKSAISWVVEFLCFGAPKAHMIELQRVWVDKSTSSPRWKDFNDKISKEWISITIYSTVMLTVDLSFLTLPSVNAQTPYSAAFITAYLSTFCVVGSLAVSILLAGQNRKYGNVSANSAVTFITKMTDSVFGDKALATIHSLPYVLLMWGMIYFFVAFSFLVFKSTSVVLLGISGAGLSIVFVLTVWPICAASDFQVFSRLRERLNFSG